MLREKSWKTWLNTNGQTTSIRAHLRDKHGDNWISVVIKEKLKDWQLRESEKRSRPQKDQGMEPFTLAGLYERLVRWVAADDQVCL